ncbi:MAG: alcohol dehydrogenase catalytic domain-containing protein, partial [Lentisphaeria bacterium]|nr:alcohol dehydrogenase catalytic domain-containing protein [Lentisphaeria bacterium]
MKMLVVIEGGNLEVVETETPQPAPGELLVNIAVSAICGSEVKGYKGGGGVGTNHGHEGAGVVAAVGEGVDSAWVGKRVGCSAISGCGQCQWCAQGAYTWCTTARKFHSAMHADFVAIPPMACYELPDSIDWEVGALVSGDGFGVPFHTDRNIHNPDAAKIVAIFGLGPIGLGSVMLQHYRGRRVIGVDLSQTRLDFATERGADHVIKADEADAVEEIKKLTDGLGADLCIEAVGVPAT